MDLGLNSKVFIIIGGGRGIGRVTARTLAGEGAKLVINGLSASNAERVVLEIRQMGGEAISAPADVRSLSAMEKIVERTMTTFGRIDGLIFGATGVNTTPFLDTLPGHWSEVIDISLIGAMNCSRAVLPALVGQKSGRLIFLGSDAGRTGDAYQPVYASVKGGTVSFAKSLARELGRNGVTVNVVSPALVVTEENRDDLFNLFGLYDETRLAKVLSKYATRRLGRPEEVASLTAFLLSEKAGHITGQTISVNGGYCMM